MLHKMHYRLALDLGSTSLGWVMIRLVANQQPCAIIKAGVRIFSSGRNPKDGSSLAVTRREARSMRRRRDRLLKRKARMMKALIDYGFFPSDKLQRKSLEILNPYELRAKGLNGILAPAEFGRALFHINQRRGFKSNRKTDKKDSDSGAMKTAISYIRSAVDSQGKDGKPRTVGELLWRRLSDTSKRPEERTVRARYHQQRMEKEDGKTRIDKYYDLYIDRAMIEEEFDILWKKQAELTSQIFTEKARIDLKDILLRQRPLKPVKPGRCTFMPDEERAPLALPSTQRFRMYQEVNNLRILRGGLKEEPLTLKQRDDLIAVLEKNSKCTFKKIKNLLKLSGTAQFNFEDPKRQELKGNSTSAILSRKEYFGEDWFKFDESKQDAIVMQLVTEENEVKLILWLQQEHGIDEQRAEAIANVGLPEGYGNLCKKALARILPELRRNVITYDKAVQAAGFDHHSSINPSATGEILSELPYYGIPLQRHVGFGTNDPSDNDEKRYGKIANPTVHIGLNQVRLVVNTLLKRYGHPSEVIIEVARDLKQSKKQRDEEVQRQTENQKRNVRFRTDIANVLNIHADQVRRDDIEKMILWDELSPDKADRKCPYSGIQISAIMLLSDQVEIEHILPFSRTLDDSLNNKSVALRKANQIKGNRTPWEARHDFAEQGWDYIGIQARVEQMPKTKRYRFGEDGYQHWLKTDADFLARALNDTRHLSKVVREYLCLICPKTRVIPGRMTALLRAKFGLNDVLGLNGEKNRNDHRHHAVDACVIGITDQSMLQKFAKASASACERQLNRLVEHMPLPWESYREHVRRAVNTIWVSHKPDHSFEGTMHEDTAYRPPHLDAGNMWRTRGIGGNNPNEREVDTKAIVALKSTRDNARHKTSPSGIYKGYVSGSNYCIEIVNNEKGTWGGEVISTFAAYQLMRGFAIAQEGVVRLRHSNQSISNKPLVMRLMIGDIVKMEVDRHLHVMRVVKMGSNGQIFFASHNEANVDARNNDKHDKFTYISKTASALQKTKARRVTISLIGELRDSGFKG